MIFHPKEEGLPLYCGPNHIAINKDHRVGQGVFVQRRRPQAILKRGMMMCKNSDEEAHFCSPEDEEESKKNEDTLEVKVVNTFVEPYLNHVPMLGIPALKFNNRELDKHYLFVRPLDEKEAEKFGLGDVVMVLANQYKEQWDNIPEYARGILTIKRPESRGYATKYQIELIFDTKTQEFITA